LLVVSLLFVDVLPARPLRSTLFPYTTLFRSPPAKSEVRRFPASSISLIPTLAERNVSPIALSVSLLNVRSSASSLGVLICRALRSEEHTSELQSRVELVCRLLLEKKNVRIRY